MKRSTSPLASAHPGVTFHSTTFGEMIHIVTRQAFSSPGLDISSFLQRPERFHHKKNKPFQPSCFVPVVRVNIASPRNWCQFHGFVGLLQLFTLAYATFSVLLRNP